MTTQQNVKDIKDALMRIHECLKILKQGVVMPPYLKADFEGEMQATENAINYIGHKL